MLRGTKLSPKSSSKKNVETELCLELITERESHALEETDVALGRVKDAQAVCERTTLKPDFVRASSKLGITNENNFGSEQNECEMMKNGHIGRQHQSSMGVCHGAWGAHDLGALPPRTPSSYGMPSPAAGGAEDIVRPAGG